MTTFGTGDFGGGTFGTPAEYTTINVIHEDGTVTAEDFTRPHAWLPDGTGYRVRIRFVQADEGLPTYNGLRAHYPTYTDVVAAFSDYIAIVLSTELGVDIDYDISCFVTGTSIQSGRNGLFDVIDAATAKITLTTI